jgi:hypothetical protein
MDYRINLPRIAERVGSVSRKGFSSGGEVPYEFRETLKIAKETNPEKYREIESRVKSTDIRSMLTEKGLRILDQINAEGGGTLRAASGRAIASSDDVEHKMVMWTKHAINKSFVSILAVGALSFIGWSARETYYLTVSNSWSEHDWTYILKALSVPIGITAGSIFAIFEKSSPEFSELGSFFGELIGSKDKRGFKVLDYITGRANKKTNPEVEVPDGVTNLNEYRKKRSM